MEYELVEEVIEDRCALVARRDGGLEGDGLLFRKDLPATPSEPRYGARRPATLQQMGE